jgi:hypothetical protein
LITNCPYEGINFQLNDKKMVAKLKYARYAKWSKHDRWRFMVIANVEGNIEPLIKSPFQICFRVA